MRPFSAGVENVERSEFEARDGVEGAFFQMWKASYVLPFALPSDGGAKGQKQILSMDHTCIDAA